MIDRMEILDAKKIGFAKTALGLSSSKELANRINMGEATVRRIEANSPTVRLDTVVKARKALDKVLLEEGWELISNSGIKSIEASCE